MIIFHLLERLLLPFWIFWSNFETFCIQVISNFFMFTTIIQRYVCNNLSPHFSTFLLVPYFSLYSIVHFLAGNVAQWLLNGILCFCMRTLQGRDVLFPVSFRQVRVLTRVAYLESFPLFVVKCEWYVKAVSSDVPLIFCLGSCRSSHVNSLKFACVSILYHIWITQRWYSTICIEEPV